MLLIARHTRNHSPPRRLLIANDKWLQTDDLHQPPRTEEGYKWRLGQRPSRDVVAPFSPLGSDHRLGLSLPWLSTAGFRLMAAGWSASDGSISTISRDEWRGRSWSL